MFVLSFKLKGARRNDSLASAASGIFIRAMSAKDWTVQNVIEIYRYFHETISKAIKFCNSIIPWRISSQLERSHSGITVIVASCMLHDEWRQRIFEQTVFCHFTGKFSSQHLLRDEIFLNGREFSYEYYIQGKPVVI